MKYRPSAVPEADVALAALGQGLMIWPAASTGSGGRPSDRVKTLALPPGSAARAGRSAAGDVVLVGAAAEHAVDGLVDSAVAAEGQHQPEPCSPGARGQPGGVAPVACLHDLELDGGGQGADDDIPAEPGRGGGMWVHDQKRAHALRLASMPRQRPAAAAVVRPASAAGRQGHPAAADLGRRRRGVEAAGVLVAADPRRHRHRHGKSYQNASGIAITMIGIGDRGRCSASWPAAWPGPPLEPDARAAHPAVHRHRRHLPACRRRATSGASRRCCWPWPDSSLLLAPAEHASC